MISNKKIYRPTIAFVDLKAIAHNVRVHLKHLGENGSLLAVVKADGYGHGACEVLRIALEEGAAWAGVATVEEAIDIRDAGFDNPILLLGEWFPEAMEAFFSYRITPVIYSLESANLLHRYAQSRGKRIKVHLKLDTGMGRLGFLPNSVKDFLAGDFSFLEVEGVMSHFSSADEGKDTYTVQQKNLFVKLLEEIKQTCPIKWIHISNSAGIADFDHEQENLFRLGIALYGQPPSAKIRNPLDLKEAIQWETRIGQLQWVEAGMPISYGRTYITPERRLIATLPVGYADGYSRLLSNKAFVLVHGNRIPVIGRVCMDMIMIDVTSVPDVKIFDKVTLIGKQNDETISASEMAEWAGTINYEITCAISKRVPRQYLY